MEHSFNFDALARELARGLSRREALRRLAGGFAGALLAALGLERVGVAAPSGGNSACAHWCHALPPGPDTDHCTSDAAHGQGLCFRCGPAAPAGHPDVCIMADLGATCCPTAAPDCCSGRCTNAAGDSNNCGQCGHACASGESCQDGQCQAECPTCFGVCPPPRFRCGTVCCPVGGDCQIDEGPRGLIYSCSCPMDQCGEMCVDLQSDPANCGACGVTCSARESCVNGRCTCTSSAATCPVGESCCSGLCINTSSDGSNCGACGHRCTLFPVPQTCCNGACCPGTCCNGACCFEGVCCNGACCPPGKSCCGGQCIDTSSDPNNCGTCGNACGGPAPFMEICCNGVCCLGSCCNGACCEGTCCNGSCCEGACCNNVCCAAGQLCTDGTCVCPVDEVVCSGACVNPGQDTSNCGGCGVTCAARQNCVLGRCTCQIGTQCPNGESCCSGQCANLQSDPANCGRCFNRCGPGQSCCSGVCSNGSCGAG